MTQNCYVKVTNNSKNEFYDVGPFINSGSQLFSESECAINWIYKQIGLIKVEYPEANLVKHRWCYLKDDFTGPFADIKVEISDFTFEIFTLVDYKYHNVISELVDENHIPLGFNLSHSNLSENDSLL
ncbi:hypothetical protein QVN76_05050 [Yersinia rochesterensis]|uniref:hypothetical protein n=1 Tax=Yersinia rochesterensis TaxID=1604335 RepID=UPI0025AABDDA|nr:hypothetical protein [Yersinia rochesterensis]MDN0106256.1 hypothetical protein [Yersinia rochesterensis]